MHQIQTVLQDSSEGPPLMSP